MFTAASHAVREQNSAFGQPIARSGSWTSNPVVVVARMVATLGGGILMGQQNFGAIGAVVGAVLGGCLLWLAERPR